MIKLEDIIYRMLHGNTFVPGQSTRQLFTGKYRKLHFLTLCTVFSGIIYSHLSYELTFVGWFFKHQLK